MADRQVTYRIKAEADSRAISEMEQRTKRLEDQASRTSRAMSNIGRETAGRGGPGGAGGGDGQSGGLGAAALAAGKVGLALAAVDRASAAAAKGLDALNRGTLDTSHGLVRLAQELPLIGNAFKAARDLLTDSGVARAEFERDTRQFEQRLARQGVTDAAALQGLNLTRGVNEGRDALAAAGLRAAAVANPLGEYRQVLRDERQAPFLAGPLLERERAAAGLAGAQSQRRRAVAELGDRELAVRDAQQARDAARDRLDRVTRDPNRTVEERLVAIAAVREKEAELARRASQLQEAQNNAQQKALSATQAAAEKRQAEVGILEGRLGLLRQQEGRVEDTSRQFVNLSRLEQAEVLRVAEKAQKGGIASLPADQRELLGRFPVFADQLRKAELDAGQDNPRLQRLLEISGERSFRETQKQRVQLEEKIAVQVTVDAAAIAKETADALDKFAAKLIETIKAQAGATANKIAAEQKAGNLQAGQYDG